MNRFQYIEDYIEFIAGVKDRNGRAVFNWSTPKTAVINLARYDIAFIQNLAQQFADNIGLSEKQAELACKIVLKYKKQLASIEIDVTVCEQPMYRLPLRRLDYSRRLYIADNQIQIKFPFETELIDQLRQFAKISHGECCWNKEKRVWQAALTEFNLNWLYTWASESVKKFTIDDEVSSLFNKIISIEKQNFEISLNIDSRQQLYIENCPDSLKKYIEAHCGGFDGDNLIRLADVSAVLGFSLSQTVTSILNSRFDKKTYNLITNREIKLNPISTDYMSELDCVFDYLDLTERYPAVIYEPNQSSIMLEYLTNKYSEDMLVVPQRSKKPITDKIKVIYTNKPFLELEKIPALITFSAMMLGGDRAIMFQLAEKIVYCTANVYSNVKRQPGKKVKIIESSS